MIFAAYAEIEDEMASVLWASQRAVMSPVWSMETPREHPEYERRTGQYAAMEVVRVECIAEGRKLRHLAALPVPLTMSDDELLGLHPSRLLPTLAEHLDRLRSAKDYPKADRLRDWLVSLGYAVGSADFVLDDPNGDGAPFVKVTCRGRTEYLRCVRRSDRARLVTPAECGILRAAGINIDRYS